MYANLVKLLIAVLVVGASSCASSGESGSVPSQFDDQFCRDRGYDHAMYRFCGNGYSCFFCVDAQGKMEAFEDPNKPRVGAVAVKTENKGAADAGEPMLTAKRKAAQTLSGVEVAFTPEIQKKIDKCLEDGGVVDGVGANGVICTMAY